MVRITLQPVPHEVDLGHGVRVTARPFTTALVIAVRADLAAQGLPSELSPEEARFRWVVAVARAAITGWEGISGEDDKPLDPTPEAITAMMDVSQLYDAFYRGYIVPRLVLDDEKKGFAPLPSGTSAGAPTIARAASKSRSGAVRSARKP